MSVTVCLRGLSLSRVSTGQRVDVWIQQSLGSLSWSLQCVTVTISCLSWCCIRHQKPSRNSRETSITTCTSCGSAAPSHPLCSEFHSAAAVTSHRPHSLSTHSPIALYALTACMPISQNDSRMMDHFPAKKVFRLHTSRRRSTFTYVGREAEREKQKPWQGNTYFIQLDHSWQAYQFWKLKFK